MTESNLLLRWSDRTYRGGGPPVATERGVFVRTGMSVCLALVLGAPAVHAQERNGFALGVNYTQRLANDDRAHGNGGVGITWRIGHSDQGWGWTYGLGWYATDIERTVGGRDIPLGELKVRPFVGGYGYTHQISQRWFVTGDVVGGFALTSLNLTREAAAAYGLEATGDEIDTGTRVIPLVRPEVRTWYDLNRKWGVTLSGWYAIARPKITIITPGSRESLRLHADTFAISAGIVYRIFSKEP